MIHKFPQSKQKSETCSPSYFFFAVPHPYPVGLTHTPDTMKRRSNQLARATSAACRRHLRGLRPLSTTCPVSSSSAPNTERPVLPRLNLDDSTSSLLHDLHLGTGSPQGNDKSRIGGVSGRRRYQRPLIMDEKDLEALNEVRRMDGQEEWVVTEAEELRESENKYSPLHATSKPISETKMHAAFSSSGHGDGAEPEHDFESHREERRSPAAVFGSKRIGSVVLPEHLLDSIQRQIDGRSCTTVGPASLKLISVSQATTTRSSFGKLIFLNKRQSLPDMVRRRISPLPSSLALLDTTTKQNRPRYPDGNPPSHHSRPSFPPLWICRPNTQWCAMW